MRNKESEPEAGRQAGRQAGMQYRNSINIYQNGFHEIEKQLLLELLNIVCNKMSTVLNPRDKNNKIKCVLQSSILILQV